MARFEARQQADIYPRTPDPQVLGVDLLSLVLGKNPLLPPPTSTPTNDIPVTTTVVTKFPVTTTVTTTGSDGQPTTVIRTNTETVVLLTTTNDDDDPNPVVTRSGSIALNHATISPGHGSNRNGDAGTSTARDPSGVAGGKSTELSESAAGVALKASLVASKSCVSTGSCDWQFGTVGTGTGSPGLSPTGGTDRPDRANDNLNLGALIGGVIGAIIGTALLVLAIYFLVRARRRRAANNADDATGLLSDDSDPFRFMCPPNNSLQSRMTVDTQQLQRSPSFGTLYGLRYNPDAAGGSVLIIGNPPHSVPLTPPPIWKPFTPSVPPRDGPESPICPNFHSGSRPGSDITEVCRRTPGVSFPDADHRSPSSVTAVVVAENPFAAEADPPDHGNGTASRENLVPDVKHTISQSSDSDYSDTNC